MNLGTRLFDLRQKAKVSLQHVADAVGVSKAHIWELEKGRSSNPSFDLVQKLATFFCVKPEELIGLAEVPPPEDQQVERIHRGMKGLSERDLRIIETMVTSMRSKSDDEA